jgi:hypothetical protein
MSFADDLEKFGAKTEKNLNDVFVGVVEETHRSIVEGSEITGAPGQPVDTGNLRASWQRWFPSQTEAVIGTNVDYAVHVEDNVRGVTFRNHGPHSVKITKAGFDKIVGVVVKRVVGNG